MTQPDQATLDYRTPTTDKVGHYRWVICALLFAVTTINYVDRQTLSQLKPLLQQKIHFDEAEYGWMNFAFTAGYAIMYVLAGRFVDWAGTRKGLAVAVTVWSLACMAHALVASALGFAIARFVLAMGEAANFPAAIKTTARWFPKKERALATGIFNSGSNIGLMLLPIFVYVAKQWGWQAAFLLTGVLGLAWLVWWLLTYHPPEHHPRLSAAELAYIKSDGESTRATDAVKKTRWTLVLRSRQAWPFLIGKFLTDPVWWFFLFWIPSYLTQERHMSLLASATSLLIPYTAASVGSIGGGWISSALIRRGYNVALGRYVAMGVCAVCMPMSIYAAWAHHEWAVIALISLALAAHQGWSANIFTTATDMFPSSVAGSIVGLGGTAGAIGGMLMTLLAGAVIQYTRHYAPMFIWAGLMHPLSLIIYLVMVGTRRTQADVTHTPRGVCNPLLIAGVLISVVGAASLALTVWKWKHLVTLLKGVSAAAAGCTAAGFVVLIGLFLIYAAIDRSHEKTEAAA